jgi:hypothetical protein
MLNIKSNSECRIEQCLNDGFYIDKKGIRRTSGCVNHALWDGWRPQSYYDGLGIKRPTQFFSMQRAEEEGDE